VQCVAHKQPALTARCAQSVGLVVGESAGGARAARHGVDGAGRAGGAAGAASQQLLASKADDCRDVCRPGTCQEGRSNPAERCHQVPTLSSRRQRASG
jgi:hypothetical protein